MSQARPRAVASAVLVVGLCALNVRADDPPPRDPQAVRLLPPLERAIRQARTTPDRIAATSACVAFLRGAGDLESAFPLNHAESELCKVFAAEKSTRAGPYRRRTGHHVIVLVPESWSSQAGEAVNASCATLDAAFVLLADLTGADFEAARGRRLVVLFSPDHSADGAQTLEGVVFAGLGLLSGGMPEQILFHEFSHELFPAPNLRPRFESFNEMWPELGRQYVLWHLGRTAEYEENRSRYLATYRERQVARGLPLEQLGPYDVGAGFLQTLVDAALKRDAALDFEPLRSFFRSVGAVPAVTESFHQRQETLACCLLESLGPSVAPVLAEARFDFDPAAAARVRAAIASAGQACAQIQTAARSGNIADARHRLDALDRLDAPGDWRSQAHIALAGALASKGDNDGATVELERAGCLLRWRVVGPFPNPRGAGIDREFAPERGVDLAASVDSPSGPLRWQEAAGSRTTGYVDLAALFSPCDEVLAYAFAEVSVEKEVDADLFTGSDDSLAIFVNGARVLTKPWPRGCFVDSERTRVRFRAGKNQLLLKVGNFRGGFGYLARLADPAGRPVR